ncbi:MAG: hypothetical protein ACTHXA_13545 [Gulosibacter sp.]|uniref:hypothetical protein n=1 Tax=Gulosibacter sp. TaxID=2817531 RepID=UPI003F8FC61C
MFGWFRKLTQRTTDEEFAPSSPSDAPEDTGLAPEQNQLPTPAAPAEPSRTRGPEPAPIRHAQPQRRVQPQQSVPLEEQLVEVYTPEPMPEPPTFAPPEPAAAPVNQAPAPQARPALSEASSARSVQEIAQPKNARQEFAQREFAQNTRPEPVVESTVTQPDAPAETPVAQTTAAHAQAASAVTANDAPSAELEIQAEAEPESPLEAEFDGLLSAPSPRPAMPLSAHPNFAGLGLAKWEPVAPRLLEPEAALTPEAQEQLLKLFDDLFGPCGRYRLEWRTERHPGDDAMFAEIMTSDLVRRVQNTIADVAELERPTPPKAIGPAFRDREEEVHEESSGSEDQAAAEYRRAS